MVRYVKAIDHRLAKLPEAPHEGPGQHARRRCASSRATSICCAARHRDDITAELVDIGWLLEELRVSVFAQQLGAARGTSAARIAKALTAHGG